MMSNICINASIEGLAPWNNVSTSISVLKLEIHFLELFSCCFMKIKKIKNFYSHLTEFQLPHKLKSRCAYRHRPIKKKVYKSCSQTKSNSFCHRKAAGKFSPITLALSHPYIPTNKTKTSTIRNRAGPQ